MELEIPCARPPILNISTSSGNRAAQRYGFSVKAVDDFPRVLFGESLGKRKNRIRCRIRNLTKPLENLGCIGNAGPVSPCPLGQQRFPIRTKQASIFDFRIHGRMRLALPAEKRPGKTAEDRADDGARHRNDAPERRPGRHARTSQRR